MHDLRLYALLNAPRNAAHAEANINAYKIKSFIKQFYTCTFLPLLLLCVSGF